MVTSLLLAGGLVLVAEGPAAAQVAGQSDHPDVSANGRRVVFQSTKKLVAGDTNAVSDIYLRDTVANRTFLISRTAAGKAGNKASVKPSISTDGRWVAFESAATNLVTGDTNGVRDVFMLDRSTGSMRRISVKGATQGNQGSFNPAVAGTGATIAFETDATNLVAGDTNARRDIVVWRKSSGLIRRVSVTSAGRQANGDSREASISDNGSRVAFFSNAVNLGSPTATDETIEVRDTEAATTYRINTCADSPDDGISCTYYEPLSLSGNGQRIGFGYYTLNDLFSSSSDKWAVVSVPAGEFIDFQAKADWEFDGIALNRDGTAYAVSFYPFKVKNSLGTFESHDLAGRAAISADGLRVAVASYSSAVYLWDTAVGTIVQVDVP